MDEQRSSRSRRRTVASPRLSTTRWPSRLPTLTRFGTSRGGAAAARERDVFAPTCAAWAVSRSARLGRRFIEAAVRRRDAACLASPASKRARTGRGAIAFVLPPARTALLQCHDLDRQGQPSRAIASPESERPHRRRVSRHTPAPVHRQRALVAGVLVSPAIGEEQGRCASALVCAHLREDADVIARSGLPWFSPCDARSHALSELPDWRSTDVS